MKICFTSALFCDPKKLKTLDKPTKFERNPNYDYFLFTNLDAGLLDTSWDVVDIRNNVNIKDLDDDIRKSRYPKFLSWHLLESMKMEYDVIFYCDVWISPNINKDWESLAKKILQTKRFPFAQTEHNREQVRSGGIIAEMEKIIESRRDTLESMSRTKFFFSKYDPSVNLTYPRYYENTCFGYAVKNEIIRKMTRELWTIYTDPDLVSYRDQPLWNFLLLRYDCTPISQNDMKDNTLKLTDEFRRVGILTKRFRESCWFIRKYENEGTMREGYTQ